MTHAKTLNQVCSEFMISHGKDWQGTCRKLSETMNQLGDDGIQFVRTPEGIASVHKYFWEIEKDQSRFEVCTRCEDPTQPIFIHDICTNCQDEVSQ